MKTLKLVLNLFYTVLIIFLVCIAVLSAANALNLPNGIKLFTVQSGSMEPAIHTGAVVFVSPQSDYQPQDIITFQTGETTTTHRLHSIKTENDQKRFETKGDANDAPDGSLVDPATVIGKVIFSIPLLGYPISFARTQTGLIVLIIIPATIIVYGELINIKKEVVTIIQKKKKVKDTPNEESTS